MTVQRHCTRTNTYTYTGVKHLQKVALLYSFSDYFVYWRHGNKDTGMESKHEAFLVSFVSPFLCSVRFSGGYYGVQFLQCPQTKHLSLQKVSKCIRNAVYSTMRAQNVVTLRNLFLWQGWTKAGQQNFVRCRLLFEGPQYWHCFTSPIRRLEFWVDS